MILLIQFVLCDMFLLTCWNNNLEVTGFYRGKFILCTLLTRNKQLSLKTLISELLNEWRISFPTSSNPGFLPPFLPFSLLALSLPPSLPPLYLSFFLSTMFSFHFCFNDINVLIYNYKISIKLHLWKSILILHDHKLSTPYI